MQSFSKSRFAEKAYIKMLIEARISQKMPCKLAQNGVCLHAVSDLGLAYGSRPEYPVPRW